MSKEGKSKPTRSGDPYLDRRSGEDRRECYDSDYHAEGGTERRSGKERRRKDERRDRCIRVSAWSSICPDEAARERKKPEPESSADAGDPDSKPVKRSPDSR
jgi:hypothetical protein